MNKEVGRKWIEDNRKASREVLIEVYEEPPRDPIYVEILPGPAPESKPGEYGSITSHGPTLTYDKGQQDQE